MFKDKLLELASAQAVTASAASTNIIDQGAANALDSDTYVICRCAVSATAAGAATVEFQLQTSVDAAFTTPIVLYTSGAIGKAAILANKEMFKVEIPMGTKQYIRGYYVVSTGPLTAGSFDMFFSDVVDAK